MASPYPTWIEVDLGAIQHNLTLVKRWVNVPVMAVVKDNAYGHGAVEVSRAALEAGAAWLAVARVQEGLDLRAAGIETPVLVLGGAVPQEVDAALAAGLTLPVYGCDHAEMISARARALGLRAPVHLKIDTGMGRFGVFPYEARALAARVQELDGLEVDGIFSHFPLAGEDGQLSELQIRRFKVALEAVRAVGVRPRWIHMANTAAIIHETGSFFNLVRAGGVLYGQGLGQGPAPFTNELRRTFTWKAQIVSCRKFPANYGIGYGQTYHTAGEEYIGVIPAGYGDGYQRASGASVLVNGRRAPVVGRVCMDQLMVRLPEDTAIGTEVVLVGAQGNETITQEELQAVWKSSFSAVTLVHPRVPRVYFR